MIYVFSERKEDSEIINDVCDKRFYMLLKVDLDQHTIPEQLPFPIGVFINENRKVACFDFGWLSFECQVLDVNEFFEYAKKWHIMYDKIKESYQKISDTL